jgi:dipeptidyl aminopeptidase/acylaminoacyl peptidase
MTESVPTICPHLGLSGDRTVIRTQPDVAHRCYARVPPASPDEAHQRAFCMVPAHVGCPYYRAPEPTLAAGEPRVAPETAPPRGRPGWRRLALLSMPLVLLFVVAFVYGRDLLQPPVSSGAGLTVTVAPSEGASEPATAEGAAAADSAGTPQGSASPTPVSDTAASGAAAPAATPTALSGGRVLTIAPRAGGAGWWTSGEAHGNHLGDSYLYTGYYDDQAFVSAIRFDLRQVPRGAPIEKARLQLSGLQADRFDPAAGGNWQVQLLPGDAVPDLVHADFQALFSAPAAVTFLPTLFPVDLAPGQVNTLALDGSARNWLAQQITDGATEVIARITGPAGGKRTLFAWDSGAGPATGGAPPLLILSLGAPPPTPPPFPTEAVIIATLTPTPANVLTAAANALAATAFATSMGTPTPLPYRVVTPTPEPANLATVQAERQVRGLPPLVIYTLTPANGATATADALQATAIAATTGTFTPVPTDAVTPLIVLPTPVPEDVFAAAAQLQTATAQARTVGTVTPVPAEALIATTTPTRVMVGNTATPENAATARAYVAYATAIAVATGTFTPLPPLAATFTPVPQPTPLPLLVPVTPAPPPTPTATPPGVMPAALAGKVLFYSDRSGQPQLYALDPANGQLSWVTQDWPYALARSRDALSADGRYTAFVQNVSVSEFNELYRTYDTTTEPQVFVRDNQYNTAQQLTHGNRMSYDASMSPNADRVVYVSVEPGNDEIFVANRDGSNAQRLTSNTWEWDKHPSWSPDGQQIVFWSNRDSGRRQLWIMNADGSNQRLLLASPYNDWDPIWVK